MGCCSLGTRKTDMGPATSNRELKKSLSCEFHLESQVESELLRHKFVELDKDKDDMLNCEEMIALYDAQDRVHASKFLDSIIQEYDKGHKGKLNWTELVTFVGHANMKQRCRSINADWVGLLLRLNVNIPEWRDSLLFTRSMKGEDKNNANPKLGNALQKHESRDDVLRIRRHDGRVLLCLQHCLMVFPDSIANTSYTVVYGTVMPSEISVLEAGNLDKFKCKWTDEWSMKYRRQVIQERYRTMEDEFTNWAKHRGTPGSRKAEFKDPTEWKRVEAGEHILCMDLNHGLAWPAGKHVLKLIEVMAEAEQRFKQDL